METYPSATKSVPAYSKDIGVLELELSHVFSQYVGCVNRRVKEFKLYTKIGMWLHYIYHKMIPYYCLFCQIFNTTDSYTSNSNESLLCWML